MEKRGRGTAANRSGPPFVPVPHPPPLHPSARQRGELQQTRNQTANLLKISSDMTAGIPTVQKQSSDLRIFTETAGAPGRTGPGLQLQTQVLRFLSPELCSKPTLRDSSVIKYTDATSPAGKGRRTPPITPENATPSLGAGVFQGRRRACWEHQARASGKPGACFQRADSRGFTPRTCARPWAPSPQSWGQTGVALEEVCFREGRVAEVIMGLRGLRDLKDANSGPLEDR